VVFLPFLHSIFEDPLTFASLFLGLPPRLWFFPDEIQCGFLPCSLFFYDSGMYDPFWLELLTKMEYPGKFFFFFPFVEGFSLTRTLQVSISSLRNFLEMIFGWRGVIFFCFNPLSPLWRATGSSVFSLVDFAAGLA